MSDTKLTIDARQAFSELAGIDKALAELEARFRRLPQIAREGFRSNLSAPFAANVQAARANAEQLRNALEDVGDKNRTAFNPAQARQYAQALAQSEKAAQGLDRAAQSGERLSQNLGTGAQLFRGLLGVAAGAASALSLTEAVTSGIRLNAEYERIRTSLTVILKDAGKADDLLGKLTQFAAETPFQQDQINSAATALLAFGESEQTVIDRLREIGDLSAATGKDFNELATIYGKARVAGVLYAEDINQLVEAGIPIVQEFAKQLGVSESEVKKLASQGRIGFSQLQTAFTNLTTEGGKFSGLMQAQSQTLGGQLSTLRDTAAQVLRLGTSWAGVTRLVQGAARQFTDLFNVLRAKMEPAQKTQIEQTRESQAQFNLEIEALKRSNFTQGERARAIREINDRYKDYLPNLIDERATIEQIAEAQERANNLFEQKILFLAFEEEYKKVLDASKKAVQDAFTAEQQRGILQQKLIRDGAQDNGRFLEAQQQTINLLGGIREEALKTAQDAPENLRRVEDSFSALAQRLGTSLADIRSRFRQAQEAGREAPLEGQPGQKGKTAADLEFARREKDLEKRRLLLNDLEDGLDKELETIRLHFEQLRIEYEKAGLDTSKLIEKQNAAEISATVDYLAALTAAEDESLKRQQKAGADILAVRRQQLEDEREARDAVIRLTEERGEQLVLSAQRAGVKEQEVQELQRQFQAASQRARLESELKFQEALLLVIGDGNERQAEEVRRKIALLREQLKTIDIQINTPIPGDSEKKRTGLLGLFGIELSPEEAQQVDAAAQQIISSLQAVGQARAEEAAAAVQAADQKVSAAEAALDREIKLAEAGFASNVTLRRQELEDAREAQRQAQQERQKALRAQLIIDSAAQASNIATSVTQIIAAWTKIPFVGFVLAIAQVASMLAFVTSIKARSRQIAQQARHGMDGFLDGDGIVRGRLHATGGHLLEVESGELVQVGDDGGRRRVQVVRRERTAEYFDLLRAANTGSREEVARAALKVAGVSQMSGAARERILTYYMNLSGLSPMLKSPALDPARVRSRVFGSDGGGTVNVTVNTSAERTNLLLEQMLRIMAAGQGGDTYLHDGTRISGNVKTRRIG